MLMRSTLGIVILGLVWSLATSAPAWHATDVPMAESPQVLRDVWYERSTDQGKIGWLNLRAERQVEGGAVRIRTVIRDHVKYLRSGDPYSEDQEVWTVETPEGAVVEVGYVTALGKTQKLRVRGRPEGNSITLNVLDEAGQKTTYQQVVPWLAAAVGLFAQDTVLEKQPLKPGMQLDLHAFMPSMNRVIPTKYTVVGPKTIRLAGEETPALEITQTYPKELYLDKSTLFVEPATGRLLKWEEDYPSFGKVAHERTTKERALATFAATVKDRESPVTINRPLNFRQGKPKQLRVRIKLEGDDDPGTIFARDGRQQVLKADREAVEFLLRQKPETPDTTAPTPEETASNFYVRCDDPEVMALAKKAIGDEKKTARQARLISRWVHNNVSGGYEVAFATADEVARTKEGDCSEMGVLAAAMARAVGIPSRLVFGLVYDPENPGFGGHLWTEMYYDGQWNVVDPTGVVPTVGAAYLKINHFTFAGVLNPDELTPLRRAFSGTMSVTVIDADHPSK
jgi:transglutaminase-like putative cysteine protease